MVSATRIKRPPKWPEVRLSDAIKVASVILQRNWGGFPYPGTQSRRFIEIFKKHVAGSYAVTCANGTVAIQIALLSLGIKAGDEVLVPAYTFSGVVAAVVGAGAVPVFVDVEEESLCIDIEQANERVGANTRCMIVVHTASRMANMDQVTAFSRQTGIPFIEDCAHVHGATWKGQPAGTFGAFGTFSLQSSKPLTTGEGGVITSESEDLIKTAIAIIDSGRNHNSDVEPHTPEERLLSGNYRMSEVHAALGTRTLRRLTRQNSIRHGNLQRLEKMIGSVNGLRILPHNAAQDGITVFRYVFMINDTKIPTSNEDFIEMSTNKDMLWGGFSCLPDEPTVERWLQVHDHTRWQVYRSRNDDGVFDVSRKASRLAIWVDERVLRLRTSDIRRFVSDLEYVASSNTQ